MAIVLFNINQVNLNDSNETLLAGLIQTKNLCFINSTLQCLFHVPIFNKWLANYIDTCDVNKECLICTAASLLKRLNCSQQSAETFATKVSHLSKLIKPARQEDVHEFLLVMLNSFDKLLNRQYINPTRFTDETLYTSHIRQMFEVVNEVRLQCTNCGESRCIIDRDFCLIVRASSSQSLSEAITLSYMPEGTVVFCELCKANTTTLRVTNLVKSPLILCVLISKWKNASENTKTLMNVPMNVTLKTDRKSYKSYSFCATAIHQGSGKSGHYVAVCKQGQNFYKYDDEVINRTVETECSNRNSYLLCYQLTTDKVPTAVDDTMNNLHDMQLAVIQDSLLGPQTSILIHKYKIKINRADILRLNPQKWLNDNIINFYMNLIIERSQMDGNLPMVHILSTFFMNELCRLMENCKKQVDVSQFDIIVVPVHSDDTHWSLILIYVKQNIIKYYDSKRKDGTIPMELVEQFLKQQLPGSSWQKQNSANSPQQDNDYDCGVFACVTMEYVSRNTPLTFTQDHMTYFRQKMILEIVSGQLLL